jgi:hypothetical protein
MRPAIRLGVTFRSVLFGVASTAVIGSCDSPPETPEEHAQALLDRYITLSDADDPAAIDLYADGGRIEKYLITREGARVAAGSAPLSEWKASMQERLDATVAKGVRATYSAPTFERDGDFVRIRIDRTITPPGVTLAQELLVGAGPDSVWRIWSEVSQVHSTRQ